MVAQLHYIEDNIEYITQLRHTVDTKTKNNLAVHKGLVVGIECSDCCWEKTVFEAGCFGGYGPVAPSRGEKVKKVMSRMCGVSDYFS